MRNHPQNTDRLHQHRQGELTMNHTKWTEFFKAFYYDIGTDVDYIE